MLEQLLKLLIIAVDPVTETRAIRFGSDQSFNFKQLAGTAKGIRAVTIRNIGNVDLILKDANEIVPPEASFVVVSDYRTANSQFEVSFGDPEPDMTANRQAVLRYNVDVC